MHLLASFVAATVMVAAVRLDDLPTKPEMILNSSGRKYTQKLTNFGDVVYTSPVSVGGQSLTALVDSGSFDQVVLSTKCKSCGDPTKLYRANETVAKGEKPVLGILSYGSGTLYTTEVMDRFAVGPLIRTSLSFWAATDAQMPLLQEDAFQVIFGIGPPGSVLLLARQEARKVREEVEQLKLFGRSLDSEAKEIVARYGGNLAHAKTSKPFVSAMGIGSVSACFFKPSGSGGYIIWEDDALEKISPAFETTRVVGEEFWSAKMKDVKLGLPSGDSNHTSLSGDSNHTSPFRSPVPLGGNGDGYDAILDTGSSLIAAPTAVVSRISEVVDQWMASGGTCDDLTLLPDLDFTFGDVKLSLPAESYVGRAYGQMASSMKEYMPNLLRSKQVVSSDGSRCQVLLTGQKGNMWVLGMPFFRKYYTTFTYKGDLGGAMSFSVADDMCRPYSSPASEDLWKDLALSGPRPATLRVDASRIRLPGAAVRRQVDTAMRERDDD